jgi:hypothetical protein
MRSFALIHDLSSLFVQECLSQHPEVAYDEKKSGEQPSASVPALPPEHSRLNIAPMQL